MKILIAEDDEYLRQGLAEIFQGEGYIPIHARNGKDALELFNTESPDFVCLDIMMPDINGYDVCKEIRKINKQVPVIFISAKSEEVDRVVGLELGADDYIVKPFGVREVVARIRAVTRRYLLGKDAEETSFIMQDITIFPAQLRAIRDNDKKIELSLRDTKILQLFYENKGNIVDRNMLLDSCWGEHIMPDSRTVDQHISQLRKRIEHDPKNPTIITTAHGTGYRFDG